ncbi:hypothetical protein BOTBODRAFT_271993 [Botryobasidium botryosum FD-172 SS1]|uniref:Uncharacterized protein n=1 Tax=Botryobasidium botryosum (strain FD-172 SS1) TaxID=930990 RepID=A0A067LUU8_BOTB1|nr:hypothetical protein BOTBODRAFT_271993 [Botryobasidium botryosum FD-172 SS1]
MSLYQVLAPFICSVDSPIRCAHASRTRSISLVATIRPTIPPTCRSTTSARWPRCPLPYTAMGPTSHSIHSMGTMIHHWLTCQTGSCGARPLLISTVPEGGAISHLKHSPTSSSVFPSALSKSAGRHGYIWRVRELQ